MLRMTKEKEDAQFIKMCFKDKVEPTKERRAFFDKVVQNRIEAMRSPGYIEFQKERIRRQQRTVAQTIQEDGAIISPVDEKAYVTKRSWDDHTKANNMVEVGNEIANKRKRKKDVSIVL